MYQFGCGNLPLTRNATLALCTVRQFCRPLFEILLHSVAYLQHEVHVAPSSMVCRARSYASLSTRILISIFGTQEFGGGSSWPLLTRVKKQSNRCSAISSDSIHRSSFFLVVSPFTLGPKILLTTGRSKKSTAEESLEALECSLLLLFPLSFPVPVVVVVVVVSSASSKICSGLGGDDAAVVAVSSSLIGVVGFLRLFLPPIQIRLWLMNFSHSSIVWLN